MMKHARTAVAGVTAGLLWCCCLEAPARAVAEPIPPPVVEACPAEPNIYSFTNVAVSLRPTNLYSAYITGPGTLTYSQTTTATATYSATASVTAEAGVVFAKASATLGVTVGASYSAAGGFTYSLPVPSGQRRRLRLFQASRYFLVTKKVFSTGQCRYNTAYSSNAANAPRKVRDDEWRLEA